MTERAAGTVVQAKRIMAHRGSAFTQGECIVCHPEEDTTDTTIRIQLQVIMTEQVNVRLCERHAKALLKALAKLFVQRD